jgi:hypothetical protein
MLASQVTGRGLDVVIHVNWSLFVFFGGTGVSIQDLMLVSRCSTTGATPPAWNWSLKEETLK